MGALGYLQIYNGTPYKWVRARFVASYNMQQWNDVFPLEILPNSKVLVPIEFVYGFTTNHSKTIGKVKYTFHSYNLDDINNKDLELCSISPAEPTDMWVKFKAVASPEFDLFAIFSDSINMIKMDELQPTVLFPIPPLYSQYQENEDDNLRYQETIGWFQNDISYFYLTQSQFIPNHFQTTLKLPKYFNFSPKNWMTTFFHELSEVPIKNLALPGSHDSGMYTITSRTIGGRSGNTITQHLDIYQQLTSGCRFFDLRPALWKDKYYMGHYGRVSDSRALGTNGASFETMINDFNRFTTETIEIGQSIKSTDGTDGNDGSNGGTGGGGGGGGGNGSSSGSNDGSSGGMDANSNNSNTGPNIGQTVNNELIIILLSHDFNTNSGEKYRGLNQLEWDNLFTLLQKNLKFMRTDLLEIIPSSFSNATLSQFLTIPQIKFANEGLYDETGTDGGGGGGRGGISPLSPLTLSYQHQHNDGSSNTPNDLYKSQQQLQPCVLVLVESNRPRVPLNSGIYQCQTRTMKFFDRYSETEISKLMFEGQLRHMIEQNNIIRNSMFVLNWILTQGQNTAVWTALGFGKGNCDLLSWAENINPVLQYDMMLLSLHYEIDWINSINKFKDLKEKSNKGEVIEWEKYGNKKNNELYGCLPPQPTKLDEKFLTNITPPNPITPNIILVDGFTPAITQLAVAINLFHWGKRKLLEIYQGAPKTSDIHPTETTDYELYPFATPPPGTQYEITIPIPIEDQVENEEKEEEEKKNEKNRSSFISRTSGMVSSITHTSENRKEVVQLLERLEFGVTNDPEMARERSVLRPITRGDDVNMIEDDESSSESDENEDENKQDQISPLANHLDELDLDYDVSDISSDDDDDEIPTPNELLNQIAALQQRRDEEFEKEEKKLLEEKLFFQQVQQQQEEKKEQQEEKKEQKQHQQNVGKQQIDSLITPQQQQQQQRDEPQVILTPIDIDLGGLNPEFPDTEDNLYADTIPEHIPSLPSSNNTSGTGSLNYDDNHHHHDDDDFKGKSDGSSNQQLRGDTIKFTTSETSYQGNITTDSTNNALSGLEITEGTDDDFNFTTGQDEEQVESYEKEENYEKKEELEENYEKKEELEENGEEMVQFVPTPSAIEETPHKKNIIDDSDDIPDLDDVLYPDPALVAIVGADTIDDQNGKEEIADTDTNDNQNDKEEKIIAHESSEPPQLEEQQQEWEENQNDDQNFLSFDNLDMKGDEDKTKEGLQIPDDRSFEPDNKEKNIQEVDDAEEAKEKDETTAQSPAFDGFSTPIEAHADDNTNADQQQLSPKDDPIFETEPEAQTNPPSSTVEDENDDLEEQPTDSLDENKDTSNSPESTSGGKKKVIKKVKKVVKKKGGATK